jgi:hypothetical protein
MVDAPIDIERVAVQRMSSLWIASLDRDAREIAQGAAHAVEVLLLTEDEQRLLANRLRAFEVSHVAEDVGLGAQRKAETGPIADLRANPDHVVDAGQRSSVVAQLVEDGREVRQRSGESGRARAAARAPALDGGFERGPSLRVVAAAALDDAAGVHGRRLARDVAQLPMNRDALVNGSLGTVVIASRREQRSKIHRRDPAFPRAGLRRNLEDRLKPFGAFPGMVAGFPVLKQPEPEPQRPGRIARADQVLQGGAKVILFGLEALEPRFLPAVWAIRFLHEHDAVGRVRAPDLVRLAALFEAFARVLADGLEHLEPTVTARAFALLEQALVDER